MCRCLGATWYPHIPIIREMANYNNIANRVQRAIPEASNTSGASIWRRMAAVFASVIDIVQLEMSRSEQRISDAARNLRVMGKQYYIDTARAYQDGSSLTIVDAETLREGYAVADPSKQIIKQVAVAVTAPGDIQVSVATTDADGNLVALSLAQLDDFQSYMTHFTPIGMSVTAKSAAPDVVGATNLFVRYSSEYGLAVIQQELEQVLRKFQTTFNADVPLYVNDVVAAIKTVAGVRDAWFEGLNATYIDQSGFHTVTPEGGRLTLNAGYFNFNPAIYDWTSSVTVFTAA